MIMPITAWPHKEWLLLDDLCNKIVKWLHSVCHFIIKKTVVSKCQFLKIVFNRNILLHLWKQVWGFFRQEEIAKGLNGPNRNMFSIDIGNIMVKFGLISLLSPLLRLSHSLLCSGLQQVVRHANWNPECAAFLPKDLSNFPIASACSLIPPNRVWKVKYILK